MSGYGSSASRHVDAASSSPADFDQGPTSATPYGHSHQQTQHTHAPSRYSHHALHTPPPSMSTAIHHHHHHHFPPHHAPGRLHIAGVAALGATSGATALGGGPHAHGHHHHHHPFHRTPAFSMTECMARLEQYALFLESQDWMFEGPSGRYFRVNSDK